VDPLRRFFSPGPRPELVAQRRQFLVSSLLGFAGAGVIWLPHFHFAPQLGTVALLSGAAHLAVFLLLGRLRHRHLVLLNFFNIGLLGFAVHYTGGILSPFTMIYVCIFVAAAGIEHWATLPAAIVSYGGAVLVEYAGWAQPVPVSAAQIYESGVITAFIVLATVVTLAASSNFFAIILRELRARVDREQAQRQSLIRRMGELEANTTLSAIFSRISHDIRGGLSGIGMFHQMVRDNEAADPKAREDSALILAEIWRIADLLKNVTRYTGPVEERQELLAPSGVLADMVQIIRLHPASKGIAFRLDVNGAAEARVMGNLSSLQQAFFNVLKNAQEALAGRAGAAVTVAAGAEGGLCRVTFRDNGPGMDAATLAKALAGFWTSKSEGTGLGLVIVREVVQNHGGSCAIESAPGAGTAITITLPLAGPSGSKDETKRSLGEPSRTQ